jgi:hypothetical protein
LPNASERAAQAQHGYHSGLVFTTYLPCARWEIFESGFLLNAAVGNIGEVVD